jgi:hypothetical protein
MDPSLRCGDGDGRSLQIDHLIISARAFFVMPAKAGIHADPALAPPSAWTPAFAAAAATAAPFKSIT